MTVAEYEKTRYFRQPNWRSNRVEDLLNGSVRCRDRSKEDPLVLEVLRYRRLQRKLIARGYSGAELGRRLMTKNPLVYQAMEFHDTGAHAMPVISLQAHLLTELTYSQIGEALQIEPAVAQIYSELFYDVTDRLDSREYIAGYVIGPVFQTGIEALNPELMAKYFAYFGGASVLSQVLYGIARDTAHKSNDEVVGFLERTISQNFKYQTAVTALLMRPSRFDVRTLIEGYVAILNIEKDNDGSQEQNWIAELIKHFRVSNPVPRSKPEREDFRRSVQGPNFGMPLEARAYERRLLAHKESTVNEMESRLKNFSLPDEGGLQTAQTKPRQT
jgi:hypothetical protein